MGRTKTTDRWMVLTGRQIADSSRSIIRGYFRYKNDNGWREDEYRLWKFWIRINLDMVMHSVMHLKQQRQP